MKPLSNGMRFGVLGTAVVLLAGAAAGYTALAADRAAAPPANATTTTGTVTLTPGPRLLTVTDRHLASVSATDPAGPRAVSTVECLRAYAAAGTGICLRPQTAWAYEVVVLDADLRPRQAIAVPGLPNRARVSPSGRFVAWTVFVGGDSYTSSGFSTRTGILDTNTGTVVDTLEDFTVLRDGKPYRNVDVNFWGVTFAADDNRFYATMSTQGRRYLVEGDFAGRTVRTMAVNVECPSLSPDGTRIAFKQAIDADPMRGWQLSVLDLATQRVTQTAEPASVDDQAAWLDAATLAYTLRQDDGRPDVWAVPADGSGAPELLIPGAESPSPLTA